MLRNSTLAARQQLHSLLCNACARKTMQFASGAVFCQLLDAYFSNVININKVRQHVHRQAVQWKACSETLEPVASGMGCEVVRLDEILLSYDDRLICRAGIHAQPCALMHKLPAPAPTRSALAAPISAGQLLRAGGA